jgi:hypothetical protein
MVWAAVSKSPKGPLIFVDNGVKINAVNCISDILENGLLPWTQRHYGDCSFIFQKDSAPAHRVKVTQNWLRIHVPDFITSLEWPPYSPDINPLDFSLWAILESKACAKPHSNLKSLRQGLQRAWSEISMDVGRARCESFVSRLKSCFKARGDHF